MLSKPLNTLKIRLVIAMMNPSNFQPSSSQPSPKTLNTPSFSRPPFLPHLDNEFDILDEFLQLPVEQLLPKLPILIATKTLDMKAHHLFFKY